MKCIILIKTRRRRKQAEERRLKVVEQERSVKEDIEKSEDKRNRKSFRAEIWAPNAGFTAYVMCAKIFEISTRHEKFLRAFKINSIGIGT